MTEPHASSEPLHVRFGEFELDEANARLSRNGNAIPLSPTPFALLCALARHPKLLLTKHALLDQVWGHRFVSDSVLKGAISDLRNVLDDDPREPRFIETVPRRGYRFVGALTSSAPAGMTVVGGLAEVAAPESIQKPTFVGRAAEFARLRKAWSRTVRGDRSVVCIAGEPGIGKTTLIEHFVSSLGEIPCIRGQCVQHYGTAEPYLPVLGALAELCRRDAEAVALLRTVAPTWLLQMPWLSTIEQREALLRELVGANPQRMLREMGEFLDRYSERQPLLLITEDLHWSDTSTIQLIDYVARRRSGCRLMWLSSFRLAEVIALDHPLNALRHELRLQGLCDEIVLDTFSETEVATLVADLAPAMADDERFVRTLHERTGGVPLFVAAIAAEVIDRVTPGEAADAARLAGTTLPESLGALIDHHISRLTGERRQLLLTAAVCGLAFRVDTLARVLARDATQITQTCEELVRERVWLSAARLAQPDDGGERSHAFCHTLFRQRLYDGMTASTRAELHRKVGAALEDERAQGVDVAAAELATHFDRGRVPTTALRYYSEAAKAALLHLSPNECITLTGRALAVAELLPVDADRRAQEITLATLRGAAAFHALGAGDEARSAYLRASTHLTDVPRHPMAGLALHGLGFLLDLRAEYAEALATAERARTLAAQSHDPLLTLAACAVQGQVLMLQGHHSAARQALEQALPALEPAGAADDQNFIGFIADPQVTVLALLSLPLAQLGLFRQARERLRQAYDRARLLGQPMALMITLWFDALSGIRRGDVARVGALADEMQSLVDEFDLAQGKTACRWFRGWADVHYGKPLAGFRQIREAYEQNRALGMISGASETLGYAAEALALHGDYEGAQEQLEQAFHIVSAYGERIFVPQLLLIQAAVARSRADPATAETSIRGAITEARAQGAPWLELLALTELVEHARPTPEDRHALAKLVGRLDEASDTSLLARALALLDHGRHQE